MTQKLEPQKLTLKPSEISLKKSVRTTFKISEMTNESLNILLKRLEIKPKELVDSICTNEKFFNNLVEEIHKSTNNINMVLNRRKTLVISKYALKLLSKKSAEQKIPRDVLFNYLVLLFNNLMEDYLIQEREKEQKASEIVDNFYSESEKIEKQLTELLGEDNPITHRFGFVIVLLMNLSSAIDTKLTEGKPIDPDDFGQS